MLERITILLLLWALSGRGVFAQQEQYSFSKVDVSQGLSHNQVNAILKDKKGFVWVGTMSGLNRYDGYTFKIFRNHPQDSTSLTDNYINSIWECPGNKLWITTRNGVSIYNPRTERFERNHNRYLQAHALPAGTVSNLVKDGQNNFWFIYENRGVYQYGADRKVKHITADAISNLVPGSDGNYWLVYRNGLLEKRARQSNRVLSRSKALQQANAGSYIYQVYQDAQDNLWIWSAEPRGAFLFKTHTGQLEHYHTGSAAFRLNSNLVNGITQDDKGLVWIGTDHGGINLINTQTGAVQYLLHNPENNKSLSQNSIYALYKDRDGLIWIGTYKQGVNFVNENIDRFLHYKHQVANAHSLPYDDVNHFVEDARGNLWIGTNGGGLIYFDRRQNKFTRYVNNPADPNSLSNNVIVSLRIDHEQKLWIGTYFGGLNCFDGKKFTHYKHDPSNPASISDDRVWEIFEDKEKNLWIGTLNGGLNLFDRRTRQFMHYAYKAGSTGGILSNYISALIEDEEGQLWIGTANGIDVFNKKTKQFTHYAHNRSGNSLSNDNVIALLQDSKGRIWAGTREGLNVFDKATRTFRSFTTAHGLPDNIVLTILEDEKQNLWITTPNGLCQLLLNDSADIQGLSFVVRHYDEKNNLQGREFNDNAALKTHSGELVVGGPYGFNIIDPAALKANAVKPLVALTGFQIFNEPIEVGAAINNRVILPESISDIKEIELRYNENIFSLEFAALDFAHSSRGKYAYKLEGFNDDWLYTNSTNRRATYTNLDPGTYYFKVKASSNNGEWSSEERVLKIMILPPFWKTPLAVVLYAIVIFGVLLLARRFVVERTRMRFQVEAQRREAERMHAIDAMKTKFFTNVSHEFRTPLSLILSPLDRIIKNTHDSDQKKQLQLVQRNAKRLLNLVNQLLDFRKMEVQAFQLHPAPGDIVRFTHDITHSFSDISENKAMELSFQSNVAALETHFDKDKLEKILFNLLSNAFKYTPDHGKVAVQLLYQPTENGRGEVLEIRVSDTGIGIPAEKHERIFERFFQNDVPPSMVNQGSGIGLAITREFVKLHQGTIRVESEPEKGTCFIVSLPVQTIAVPEAEAPLAIENVTEEEMPVAAPEPKIVSGAKEGKKPVLVLAEDSEDFRFYLKDNLKRSYEVVEAVNGKDAWEKIKALTPDLVISDIMMPLLNGLELSRRVKIDARTAHIPVVLLTAMGSDEMQLEGYKAGVNDYITKPFTFEILASRIKNLLAQQKQLRKNLQQQAEVSPAAVAITPLDAQFMKQALEVVEKNIANADFTVEELSRELFMSRVAVYKKILALTGKTPLEFIRQLRLKRGAQLLQKSQLTVAEVAYEVGFNNPKNFTRYFKEAFNELPSQYAARQKNATQEEKEV